MTAIKYLFIFAFILLNSVLSVSAQTSSEAVISILTCAPGEELYSIFGHTAIRVKDPVSNKDYVFNFGTFNFNTPNFYLKFIKGELYYILSVTTFDTFLREYQYHKRSVIEQRLNLTEVEKENIISALITNARPENREYLYHFFYDNCATRVRDGINNHLLHPLDFGKLLPKYEGITYRKAIDIYLQNSKWTKLGIDLILGSPTDEVLNSSSIQFLPDFLYTQFKIAKKNDGSSIVLDEKEILHFTNASPAWRVNPNFFFCFLLGVIIAVSLWEVKQNQLFKAVNFILFLLATLIGLLIIFLWFFTLHSVTKYNWHLIWLSPFNLLMLLPGFKNLSNLNWIPWTVIITNFSMMILLFIVPQEIPVTIIPLSLILIVRAATYLKIHITRAEEYN